MPAKSGMSAIGTKRRVALHMSAFGGKAGHDFLHGICPLMTQSGHANRPDERLFLSMATCRGCDPI